MNLMNSFLCDEKKKRFASTFRDVGYPTMEGQYLRTCGKEKSRKNSWKFDFSVQRIGKMWIEGEEVKWKFSLFGSQLLQFYYVNGRLNCRIK